jgi:hypothetical protein
VILLTPKEEFLTEELKQVNEQKAYLEQEKAKAAKDARITKLLESAPKDADEIGRTVHNGKRNYLIVRFLEKYKELGDPTVEGYILTVGVSEKKLFSLKKRAEYYKEFLHSINK